MFKMNSSPPLSPSTTLPSQGPGTKMSASNPNSAIYMTDTPSQIKNKITRHAFSGGGDTAELHALNGGNIDVDVAYQYLRFFMDNDEELHRVGEEYKAGRMSTSEMKKLCIDVVSKVVADVQTVK